MSKRGWLALVLVGYAVASVAPSLVLYQELVVNIPFSRAVRAFDTAYAAGDFAGMGAARATMRATLCRGLFPPAPYCDASAPAGAGR